MDTEQAMPNWSFRGMAWMLRLMERFKKPAERLAKIDLAPGQTVLEYGCGAGSFTVPTARIVGETGKVYAADIHPLAIEAVEKRVGQEGLSNVQTILTGRDTGLPDESVDVVLLYDTLHLVRDKQALLQELHRVLRPGGILSADHEHTDREAFLQTMTSRGLFSSRNGNGDVYAFDRV